MADTAHRRSFWTTLPGTLSAVAGLIGAIAGIIGALAAIGVVGDSGDEPQSGGATVPSLADVLVRYQVEVYATYTRFTDLRVSSVPPGTRVTLTCQGGGCFDGPREQFVPDGAEVVFLTSKVPKELRPKAVVTVRLAKDGTIGKVVEFRVVRAKLPERTTLCVPPGEPPIAC